MKCCQSARQWIARFDRLMWISIAISFASLLAIIAIIVIHSLGLWDPDWAIYLFSGLFCAMWCFAVYAHFHMHIAPAGFELVQKEPQPEQPPTPIDIKETSS